MKTLKTLRSPIPHARNNCNKRTEHGPLNAFHASGKKEADEGQECFIDVSDEKVHIGLFGSFHIACHTSHGDVVE
ncbi:MAG: hypothetical protein SPF79_01205, partial [Bacteroidaceae bacterium]|nr:hypothetical protein [Bacteroidaceae bacterium]